MNEIQRKAENAYHKSARPHVTMEKAFCDGYMRGYLDRQQEQTEEALERKASSEHDEILRATIQG